MSLKVSEAFKELEKQGDERSSGLIFKRPEL
jgi:hypothetical protein